ncbi:hypothetical protein RJT34_33046 [Clitoria ternatea]|uniref:DNA-directed RNA polymerase III subunit RPC4 n=1 Tax=Clitoria ternatea TaxID=43366 RepID=A0AAN9EZE7_CLITE
MIVLCLEGLAISYLNLFVCFFLFSVAGDRHLIIMDSKSSKDAPGAGRKVKFAPRAPPRRVPKIEVKTEVVEDTDADQAKDLLRRFNESAKKAKLKAEKKGCILKFSDPIFCDSFVSWALVFLSASQIAFGYGGESTTIKSYGIPRGGSNISHNSAFNAGVREKEYKEPWDYYSNYPVTLPLRRPYSGNPENLDEEEFGEAAESKTYDENATNPAAELGLFEENPEASMFLINLPPTLPKIKQSATAGGQNANVNSRPSKDAAEKPCNLNELPPGFMGKMLVYKSGAVKLKLGDTLYDVSPGMNCTFAQDLVAINTTQKHCCAVGEINKHATITPDIDAIIESMSDL